MESSIVPGNARIASTPHRGARALELLGVFFALPAALYLLRVGGTPVPTIPALLAVAFGLLLLLWRDAAFDLRRALSWEWSRSESRRILVLFLSGGVLVAAYTALAEPQRLLGFPRERPFLWAAAMLLYPVLSVLPQELVFRVYFFHRFRELLPSISVRLILSSVAFGFAHVIFDNWTSVVLSTMGGLLFGWTYLRRPTVWLVAFEHAIWGGFLFTIGLGVYFYNSG